MSTVLMIGTLVPDEVNEICYKNGIRHSAADIAQNYMRHGLEENDEIKSIDVIGSVRMKAYPRIKIKKLSSKEQEIKKGKIQGIGYPNLPGIAFFAREKAIISCAKKWAKKNRDKKDVVVFLYSMHSPFMKAGKAVKKIIPSAKVVLTIADLPLYMDTKGFLRRMMKQIDWNRIKKLQKSVDKYLLYTKYMAEYLNLPKDKWIVFEGLFDKNRVISEKQEKYDENICIYAGNLDSRYGINTLIEAFGKIKSNATLHIYGAGANKENIEKLASESKNVKYMGVVTSDEIFEIMKKATLLINPRPTTIGLAKYSCPSKTFEYMASGTPVLMTRLPGLPEEYHPYVFFAEENVDGFTKAIDEIMSKTKDELSDFGFSAAQFIKNEKNSEVTMKKVMDFINN